MIEMGYNWGLVQVFQHIGLHPAPNSLSGFSSSRACFKLLPKPAILSPTFTALLSTPHLNII